MEHKLRIDMICKRWLKASLWRWQIRDRLMGWGNIELVGLVHQEWKEKDKGEKEGKKIFKLFIHQCERTRFHQSAFWSSLKHCINISEKTADMVCPFRTGSMALILLWLLHVCVLFCFRYETETQICGKS